jgi:plasmid stability protein
LKGGKIMEMLHVRLPKGTHKELKICAVSQGRSMTALIGDIIERYLTEIRKEVA